jgi:CelD/BcsL family acetyltransferase involved in cellulose biosynthesis
MRVDVIDTIHAFTALKGDWEAAYMADPHTTVFTSWQWVRGWIDATRDPWLVLAVRPDLKSSYIAFLPLSFQIAKVKRFFYIRQLHFAGTPTSDHKAFVIHPEHQDLVLKSLASFIQKHLNWDFLFANEVMDPRLDAFLSEFSASRYRVQEHASTSCPFLLLPDSWDEYLMSHLGHRGRKEIRRMMRSVETLENFRVTHVHPGNFNECIDIMDRLAWGDQPAPHMDMFRGNNILPQFRQCFESGLFSGFIYWDGNVPISALSIFCDERKKYFGIYTTGYASEYTKISPGKAICCYAIRYAIKNGFREYDFLRGNESYKTNIFHAQERFNRNVSIEKRKNIKVYGLYLVEELMKHLYR